MIALDTAGRRQFVQFTATALVGVDAETGDLLWQYAAPANPMGITCSAPIAQDGLVFAASAYGTGGGAVKLTAADDGSVTAEEVYFSPRKQNHHGGMVVINGAPVIANGTLYIRDQDLLLCYDIARP